MMDGIVDVFFEVIGARTVKAINALSGWRIKFYSGGHIIVGLATTLVTGALLFIAVWVVFAVL